MPAQGRPDEAAPSLPAVNPQATVPFSTLFDKNGGFDRVTVESTAQLANRSIFVTADGRRFLVESLPPDANAPILPVSPGHHHHHLPSSVPPQPASPSQQRMPPVAPADAHRPSAAQNFGALLRKSLRRRPASNASTLPPYPGRAPQSPRSPEGATLSLSPVSSPLALPASAFASTAEPPPQSPIHQITSAMSQVNINRFSATPLFWESDGGVQAAETLMDPYPAPREGGGGPGSPGSPVSPTTQVAELPGQSHPHPLQQPPYRFASQSDPNIPPHMASPSGHIANFDYVNYTAQVQQSRQQQQQHQGPLTTATGFPSLMEFASPMPSPRRDSDLLYSPIDPVPPFSEKETLTPQASAEWRPSTMTSSLQVPSQVGAHANYVNIGRSYSSGEQFDTLTPIVVLAPPVAQPHNPSISSDSASTSRDNVMPGEDLLFDG